MQAILDTAPVCIKLLARDARLIDINPAGLAMIDAPSLEAVRGAKLAHLIVPRHRRRFFEMLADVFAGERRSLQFEVIGFSGRRLWMDTHGAPLWRDERTREVEAALFVTCDATDQVSAELHRRALEEQLRQSQKMEAVGRLAGGIAHDFNNLLTVIQGQISLIKATTTVEGELESSLHAMTEASQRAASLIRQLLTFSRRQVMQPRDLDLAVLVGNLAALLRPVLGEDIALETTLASNHLFVHADPTMMEQVILNLAVNARDAMPDGGRLTLALDRVEASPTAMERSVVMGLPCDSRCQTRALAFGAMTCRACASRSLRPKKSDGAAAWVWPPCSAFSSSTTAASMFKASRDKAQPLRSFCRP